MNATRCTEDELLVDLISQLSPERSALCRQPRACAAMHFSQKLFIFDARPKLNAMTNKVAGKGAIDLSVQT